VVRRKGKAGGVTTKKHEEREKKKKWITQGLWVGEKKKKEKKTEGESEKTLAGNRTCGKRADSLY